MKIMNERIKKNKQTNSSENANYREKECFNGRQNMTSKISWLRPELSLSHLILAQYHTLSPST